MNLGEHKGDGIRHSMHLSAPKGGLAQMLRDPDGQWVPYADYADIQAENERLKGEERVNELGTLAPARLVRYWMEKCKQNEAENERLRKAGDELARVAIPSYILDTKVKAIEGWNAAKGVQP